MKEVKNRKVWLIGSLIAVLAVIAVKSFTQFVNDRLWEKSVTDIFEVSTQGLGKLEEGLEDEFKSLSNLSNILEYTEDLSLEKVNYIMQMIKQNENGSYFIINLDEAYYINGGNKEELLDQRDLQHLDGQGISDPYYEEQTGVRVLSLYQTFTFQNGARGIVLKEISLEEMTQEYTLSFYNDTGFSYILKEDGSILIRSLHRNSNRTFQNLSEIIDYGGNEKESADILFEALAKKEKGISILSDISGNKNVICYMPVDHTEDWYLMSIIPKEVIDKQANEIILLSLLLCLGMLLGISIIMFVYTKSTQKHREEIRQMSYYDKLTMLYNFERFKILGSEIIKIKSPNRIAAVYLDIQGFKAINDIKGYDVGDQILRDIADIIRENLNQDSIAARVSADNFLLLCCGDSVDDINENLSRLLRRLDAFMLSSGKGVHMKMGICVMKDGEQLGINQFIDRARLAHRMAKKGECDCSVYTEEMREIMLKEAEIEATMEDALKNGEFVTYLQPKYNVEGTVISGAEALVRWILPDGTMRNPDSFIPLFEKNGFITKVDTFVFETVCQFFQKCIKKQIPLIPISINVSRVHLFQNDFVSKYKKIKENYKIPDHVLIIEVTETVIAESVSSLQLIIKDLHSAGFDIAIDDFGSGYSSLNILKELPVDAIKLDREFFSHVEDERKSEVIINNMVKMANELNIRSVAEGVETQKQLTFLKQAGCNQIQGYIFAKPMPIADFLALINKAMNDSYK